MQSRSQRHPHHRCRYAVPTTALKDQPRLWLRRLLLWCFKLLALACLTMLALVAAPRLAWAKTQIQTGTTPTTAFLQLGNQILLDQPGFHLSKPQLSPDGRWLAVTSVPTGAGTAALAEVYLFDAHNGTLMAHFAGYSPTWSEDNLRLAFQNGEGAAVYDLQEQRLAQLSSAAHQREETLLMSTPQLPLAYPQTIRVAHHPSNGCRDVAEWQVDVIPFEEYVARSVPAEVPASWPAAALEAMAVAARTYAWYQILAGRPTYDVTDWANFQMMCDERYPSTDAAVTATAGQYLTAKNEAPGVPILAMYSAENGHPTLTNANVTYLQAVPDLFALGRERWGHGYGLSQWGAYRRARAGQNYRQILGHYYSAVALQNGADSSQPAAALLGLFPQSSLATNGLHLATIGPLDWSPRLVITASAGLSAPVAFLAEEAIWQAMAPLTEQAVVTAQLWLQEQLSDQVMLRVDHTPPASPTLQTAAVVTQPLVTVTVPLVADVTPLLNTQWSWAGEALLHTPNSGTLLADSQASDGVVWGARVGVHQKGVWYGPRTTRLVAGYNYRALFWLRGGRGLSAAVAAQVVARLDVTDDEGREILGLRDLWTTDFADQEQYWPLAVDFHLFQAPRGVEFRVAWPGLVDLALDRVEIWRLPSSSTVTNQQFRLPFYGQWGDVPLAAAQMDSAGNLSQAVTRTLQLIDGEAPQVGPWPLPTWLTTNTISVSVPVTDSFSGLASGYFIVQGRGAGQPYTMTLPATFPAEQLSWQGQTMKTLLTDLPDGDYTLTIHALDRAGNHRQQGYTLGLDTLPPTVTAQLDATPLQGWYGAPVPLTLVAVDHGSGVAAITYTVSAVTATVRQIESMTQPVGQPYTQPISLTTAGVHQIIYAATDRAGNVGAAQQLTLALDLAAPVVRLQQVTFYTEAVDIAWQIDDDGVGVESIEMQIQRGDDAWQPAPWDYATQSTAQLLLDPERSTKVRARAQDRFGHMSEWVTLDVWRASAWIYLPMVQR